MIAVGHYICQYLMHYLGATGPTSSGIQAVRARILGRLHSKMHLEQSLSVVQL